MHCYQGHYNWEEGGRVTTLNRSALLQPYWKFSGGMGLRAITKDAGGLKC